MKKVIITDAQVRAIMQVGELAFGTGKELHLEGRLIALNPTREEFAQADPEFAKIVEHGGGHNTETGVIYFDEGAGRAYWVEEEDVEIVEVH